ncbi:metallophosphoesterase, partial [Succinivibrio sp.]|uniref:metallophosphoesterase n=1 Tax=Succinivibrio sp. TaxID=2053619 RepID=UPI00386F3974
YPFKIISCLGNHENYDVINNLPRTNAYGGRIIRLSENVELLDRGYVYNLEGYKFLSIGGAMSMDRDYRIEHESYWETEVITKTDIDVAFNELNRVGNKVDFVLTHTCPSSVLKSEINSKDERVLIYKKKLEFALERDPSVNFLEEIKNKLNFSNWFFGHFHLDKSFNYQGSANFMCLYNTWKTLD